MVLPTSAVAAECPNEVLRIENHSVSLPRCRAYERVTPAAKNGAQFQGPGFVGTGPRLELEAFAPFGGTENNAIVGTSYEFTRRPDTWSTRPLLPPASAFTGLNLTTPLYALGTEEGNLLGLRPFGGREDEENLYLSRGPSPVEIGPEVPPSSLRGSTETEPIAQDLVGEFFRFKTATPDLSHSVFELLSRGGQAFDYLWPFDRTAEGGRGSLYEYLGTGNTQPLLVGVTGGYGSDQLVSGCGASLGAYENQDVYNAMSSNGSTIFFTATGEDHSGPCASPVEAPPTTQLFARVDGETQEAHTVAISEPASQDCTACQTPLAAEAIFQGASEDGQKVFFLTSGELLSGNPGKSLYEYDFDGPAGGKVTAVSHMSSGAAAGVEGVVRVSEDGSRVYFVATSALTTEPNGEGSVAQAGGDNLFVYNTATGSTRFVATLVPEDSGAWSSYDVNRQAEATPDGRFLLFASVADLTPDDASTVSQLFRYDADTGALVRVSVGQSGFNGNGNTSQDPVNIPYQFDNFYYGQNAPPQILMSDDGSTIFFESSLALVPGAVNHEEVVGNGLLVQNLYEWHEGVVSLISDGRDRNRNGEAYARSAVKLVGTDADGNDVFFTTVSPLIPADTDQSMDVYDARIDGGFPATEAAPVCFGEGCQSMTASEVPSSSAGSSRYVGPPNPTHKKKRHHRRHVKKKRHSRHGRGGRRRVLKHRSGSKAEKGTTR